MIGQASFISALAVLAKVDSKFKLTGDFWKPDALGWIGEGIRIIGLSAEYVHTYSDVTVTDYKGKLPTCAEAITDITYKGVSVWIEKPTRNDTGTDSVAAGYPNRTWISGGWLQTNFETDTIRVHYDKLKTDDRGIPLIPNNPELMEALSWYILREYLGSGNTHAVFNWDAANKQWEIWWPRAGNSVGFPKITDQNAFAAMWVNIVPNLTQHVRGNYFSAGNNREFPLGDISDFFGTSLTQ